MRCGIFGGKGNCAFEDRDCVFFAFEFYKSLSFAEERSGICVIQFNRPVKRGYRILVFLQCSECNPVLIIEADAHNPEREALVEYLNRCIEFLLILVIAYKF